MSAVVRPITTADIPAVAAYLHAELNQRVEQAAWARALEVPWSVHSPNHGFMLVEGDTVHGVYLAFYSERVIDETTFRFCNLGAWCVRPEFRTSALRLLKALLRQEGYHFTDLSPSGNVVGINTRLGFQALDTSTALVPNLPWPSRTVRITEDPTAIEQLLNGGDLQRFRDHRHAAAAHQVVLSAGAEHCHVVFRRDRRRNLPLFATVLHVSDAGRFARMVRPFCHHLLVRHRIPATLLEARIVGRPVRASVRLPKPRPRMFLSPVLAPRQIDYLYSELVCVAW